MEKYLPKIGLTLLTLLVLIILNSLTKRIIKLQSKKHELALSRTTYIRKFFSAIYSALFLIGLGYIWDVPFKDTFASFFAIAGVALFAQWSILSNITASIILFFYVPFKLGDKIRVLDGPDTVEGTIVDITFFIIELRDSQNQIISIPNNLALQKNIIRLK